MERGRQRRILKQHVKTDQLLGVDAVPLGSPAESPSLASPTSSAGASQLTTSPAVATAERLSHARKVEILTAMDEQEVRNCIKCDLCASRTQTVFGEGDPDAQIMFVGEGPGQTEDELGRPFVGRAGELLNKMIEAMGLRRQDVFIANVVKCRPPQNRTPTPAEAAICGDYLRRQIQTISPTAIVSLGGPAAKLLLNTSIGITALRGQWHELPDLGPGGSSIAVMPTFHPAFLLRQYTQDNRAKVWSDLKQVMQFVKDHPRS